MRNTIQLRIKNAFRANIKPAIYLQTIAVAIALSYFYIPTTEPFFASLAHLKTTYGIYYSIVSTAIFGGLLPYLIMLFTKQIHFKPIAQLVFYCTLWGSMGLIVDLFYQFQGSLFGNNNDVSTIIKKVVLDQFVYNIIFAAPVTTLCFLYRDNQFRLKPWLKCINRKLFTEEIPILLISTWIVWVPAVSVIYTMPPNLQVPLFNIVLCLFVLIIALLNKPKAEPNFTAQ